MRLEVRRSSLSAFSQSEGFGDRSDAYPQWAKSFEHASGVMISMANAMAASRSSAVPVTALRRVGKIVVLAGAVSNVPCYAIGWGEWLIVGRSCNP